MTLTNSQNALLSDTNEKRMTIDKILSNLQSIIDWDYEKNLIQKGRDGRQHSLKFIEAVTLLKLYSKKLREIDFNYLPVQSLDDLFTTLRTVRFGLQQFAVNDPANVDAPESEKISEFLLAFDAFNTEARNALFFFEQFGEKTEKELEQERILTSLRVQNQEATDLLNSMKNLTQKAGIAAYSTLYKDHSELERKTATKWFWGIVGTVGITLVAAVALLFFQQQNITSEISIVQFTVTKVVIVSCLFLSIGVCIKNYRAHKHNELLNLHKSNALATFDALVKTQMDEHTKNSMLLAVTNTIFGNVSTGFNSVDNTSTDVSSKVLDFITKNKA